VRTFFAGATGAIIEDPVTGSLNASLGQYLFETGLAKEAYVAAQGAAWAPTAAPMSAVRAMTSGLAAR
jgi:predicted PhzF superfamily epimerase YddE/YHI9